MFKEEKTIAVANFIIETAKHNNKLITNLQLQKILFFIQGYVLKETNHELFNSKFSKWQYGPVEKQTYRIFRDNGSAPITDEFENAYFDDNGSFIEDVPLMTKTNLENESLFNKIQALTINLLDIPAWKLVGLTHRDPSWYKDKEAIMNYSAPDYSSDEIKKCYQNSELSFK